MTARTDAQQAHERQAAVVLELDLDKCENVYGVSPCTAGREHSGTAQAGASSSITLAADASASDDAYNSMTVRITGGTGSGQERRITDYDGTTKVATVENAWTTAPDATSTYDVIDRPNACYNTFFTCQDKANYVKGTQTIKFCTRGMPIPAGELIRPYITTAVERIDQPVAEIDWKEGLARSHKVTLELVDEPDDDRDQDPYVDDRASVAGGTFLARLIARNPNYAMRFARIKRGFVVRPWDWNTFQTELYVIESIPGPKRGRTYQVVLKDPIKLADRIKIPPATDGELAADLTAGAGSFAITGDAEQYDKYGYPTWVQIGDSTIKIASRSGQTFTVASGGWGAFNSPQEDQREGAKVQLVRAWEDTPLTDVLEDIWNEAGVDSANLDTAEMAAEDATWLGTKYHITRAIPEPTEGDKLIAQLCVIANSGQWWDPVTQKMRFKVNMPDLVGTTPPVFTDEASIILDSLEIQPLDADRITRAEIRYGLIYPAADEGENANYEYGKHKVDADAESAEGFGDERAEVIQTPWLGSANGAAATALVSRWLAYYRDVQTRWRFRLDPKDHTVNMGQLIDMQVSKHIDIHGQVKTARLRLTRLVDRGKYIEATALSTTFGGRLAFIAPTGHPDYSDATEDERQYAFICNAQGLMPDGSPGYQII